MALNGQQADTLFEFPDLDLQCEDDEENLCKVGYFIYSGYFTDGGQIGAGPFMFYYDNAGNLIEKECDAYGEEDRKYCQAIGCPNAEGWVCSNW